MSARLIAVALALGVFTSGTAHAITLRYLLVVGNNRGVDADGTEEPPLSHAEREAARLLTELAAVSSFDPIGPRTVLLRGGTREQALAAARSLAQTKASDLASLGQAQTFFAFFFTGHGREGRVLLRDGPLDSNDIGEIFRAVDADLSVGFFDACHSGSLGDDLVGKGMSSAPGLDILKELPTEVLTANGSVWFVSSSPKQPSYEDKELGGLFTHYFIEGLQGAPRDGPGITLDNVWSFARRRTTEHAARGGRQQTPQRFVAKLRSTGPLYISFPEERDAILRMGESVRGRFVLSYSDGQLSEIIEKAEGVPLELSVFSGPASLTQMGPESVLVRESLELRRGGTVILERTQNNSAVSGFGRGSNTLWEKGRAGDDLRAVELADAVTGTLSVGYAFRYSGAGALMPQNLVGIDGGIMSGPWSFHVMLAYGRDEQAFTAWRYALDAVALEATGGWNMDLGPARVGVEAVLGVAHGWQAYGDGTQRTGWSLWPGAQLSARVLLPAAIFVGAEAGGGVLIAPGAGVTAELVADAWFGTGVSAGISTLR